MLNMEVKEYILWYYSPLALLFSDHLRSRLTVYDCLDGISSFKVASSQIKQQEARLFKSADIVFTGGYSLYEAKREYHINMHPFPSCIDKKHFFPARLKKEDPADQKNIPNPRLGFYGVIDERINMDLLKKMAGIRPDWQFIMLGPVINMDPAILSQSNNIHFLGNKSYHELPLYLSGWDIAIMPFALNESTRYISPTKTNAFLAGGKPVISTSISDVVQTYGEKGLVRIADTAEEFIIAADLALQKKEIINGWVKLIIIYLVSPGIKHGKA